MIEIVVGDDICPIGRSTALLEQGDTKRLFNDLLPIINQADIAVANLECPLIGKPTPIMKTGSVLGAPTFCAKALKNAGLSLVNLANNHILDHGSTGLSSTLIACSAANLGTFGAGSNLDEAKRIVVREVNGTRIGFMGLAEHEWSIAGTDRAGANPLDPIKFTRDIRDQNGSFDFLIVFVHGGLEHRPYPTPRIRETCRFLVEQGAGAVFCHHSHCPGCYERYLDAYIVYGQGNLIFDIDPPPTEHWNRGFLVRLILDEKLASSMELVPYSQFEFSVGASLLSKTDSKAFLDQIEERSVQISQKGFLDARWLDSCNQRTAEYLNSLHGHSRWLSRLKRLYDPTSFLHAPDHHLRLLNLIRCETHREVIETILSSSVKS